METDGVHLSASPEQTTLRYAWSIGKFKLLSQQWTNLKSGHFDLFPDCQKCCKFQFSIQKTNDSIISIFSPNWSLYTINVLPVSDVPHIQNHLRNCHQVHHQSWILYALGSDGLTKYKIRGRSIENPKLCFKVSERELLDDTAHILSNDCLEFRMEFRIIRLIERKEALIRLIEPAQDLAINLGNFLETGSLTDFTIKTKDKAFEVHKVLLASRSPMMRAMLSNDMKESRTNILTMDLVDSRICEKFIRFLYTDKLELPESSEFQMAMELLKLADQYEVYRLKAMCEIKLIDRLCAGTIVEILRVADLYRAANLQRRALNFVNINKTTLSNRSDMVDLVSFSPELGSLILKALSKSKI